MIPPAPSGVTFPRSAPAPVTVLIADAHPVVRLGLRSLLADSPDLTVVGDCACEVEPVVELARELDAAVVVVGGPEADAVTARLRDSQGVRKVLVLSACEEAEAVRRAFEAGASGYALKRASAEQLVQGVRAVAAGCTYLDPGVVGPLVGGQQVRDPAGVELSEREAEVVRQIARGYSNKEIAAMLGVSVKTVETYKARALEKLGLHSRVDLVRHAVQRGWLHARMHGTFERLERAEV